MSENVNEFSEIFRSHLEVGNTARRITSLQFENNECIIASEIDGDKSCDLNTVPESRWLVRTGTG